MLTGVELLLLGYFPFSCAQLNLHNLKGQNMKFKLTSKNTGESERGEITAIIIIEGIILICFILYIISKFL